MLIVNPLAVHMSRWDVLLMHWANLMDLCMYAWAIEYP